MNASSNLLTSLKYRDKQSDQKTLDKNSLSSRLNYALAAVKITQSELARRIGVKPQAIQYICANNVQKSRFTYAIADALDIDYTWLSTGDGQMISEIHQAAISPEHQVPIVSWKQLAAQGEQFNLINYQSKNWIFCTKKPNAKTFATEVTDHAMAPRFEPGTMAIVDPELLVYPNCFVLAFIEQYKEVLLRQLVSNEDGKTTLMPINKALYRPYTLTDKDIIIGVVIEARFEYHKP